MWLCSKYETKYIKSSHCKIFQKNRPIHYRNQQLVYNSCNSIDSKGFRQCSWTGSSTNDSREMLAHYDILFHVPLLLCAFFRRIDERVVWQIWDQRWETSMTCSPTSIVEDISAKGMIWLLRWVHRGGIHTATWREWWWISTTWLGRGFLEGSIPHTQTCTTYRSKLRIMRLCSRYETKYIQSAHCKIFQANRQIHCKNQQLVYDPCNSVGAEASSWVHSGRRLRRV